MSLQAIRYSRGSLAVLDQLRLPHEHHYDAILNSNDAFDSIRSMRVRGAPAIAIVAVLALAVELGQASIGSTAVEAINLIDNRLDYLFESRPTAVDLGNAIALLKKTIRTVDGSAAAVVNAYVEEAEAILHRDLRSNLAIGGHGADWLVSAATHTAASAPISVLTHCNTGSLATSGHGTALGIIRSLHERGALKHAFCTETRPYNQGSRLTAFELVYEKIPSTLITDSMAAALFQLKKDSYNLTAVIVGADRVVRNGDTANKIGTYQLAVLARHHGIKFVVAAPTTSIDLRTPTGTQIKIEERKQEELTQILGPVVQNGIVDTSKTARVATADQRIAVWNPAFDVTPHDLIDVIVTEKGVVEKIDGNFDLSEVIKRQGGPEST
ncbi:S-methyl-5-thioribose-1-phosphate isomerase [Sporothrix epigloea]|uniref:Methylthioribose-1-phosphate isomerase n=1 Tax=Sporothrix epigloea TaxID=1892477 RepID=A0ABP0E405_9PEZI